MDKVAVLIPCYNEAKTVKKVVEDFKRELPEATIYVYDNNSKDGTDKYYSTHISVLNNKWIISNTNPNLLERRWYVMLMLMRAANKN